MKHLIVVACVGILGLVAAACEPTSGPTAPSATTSPAPVSPPPAPAPAPPTRSRPVLVTSARLSGVVSELTSDGLVPIASVDIYCDACGEFGHTRLETDDHGAYDFGRDGIWDDGTGVIQLLIFKRGYLVPGGSTGPDGSSWRTVKIDGDTRLDLQLVRGD
jgi:hypothetical protein